MPGRIINNADDVAEGAEYLAQLDSRFELALRQTGPLPLRRRPDGLAELFSAIVSQQVSTAAAGAIWARLQTLGATTAEAIRQTSDQDLRDCGLSRQKIAYARAIAASGVDFEALREKPDAQVVAELTRINGVGAWTAEIYVMFCLGRADIFAPGDLALRDAARRLFDLHFRPTEKQLRELSLAWAPWRSVAARLLWAYYRVSNNKEGVW